MLGVLTGLIQAEFQTGKPTAGESGTVNVPCVTVGALVKIFLIALKNILYAGIDLQYVIFIDLYVVIEFDIGI